MPEKHESLFRSRCLSLAIHDQVSSFFSYSYALFCAPQISIAFLFIKLRTLSQKHGGAGYALFSFSVFSASSSLFGKHPYTMMGSSVGIAPAMATQAQTKQALEVNAFFQVLGVRVDAVQITDVVARMTEWIHEKTACHSIAATGVHGIVEAQHDPELKQVLNATDLVVPDGMPLVWLGQRQGHSLRSRVYGPDL